MSPCLGVRAALDTLQCCAGLRRPRQHPLEAHSQWFVAPARAACMGAWVALTIWCAQGANGCCCQLLPMAGPVSGSWLPCSSLYCRKEALAAAKKALNCARPCEA